MPHVCIGRMLYCSFHFVFVLCALQLRTVNIKKISVTAAALYKCIVLSNSSLSRFIRSLNVLSNSEFTVIQRQKMPLPVQSIKLLSTAERSNKSRITRTFELLRYHGNPINLTLPNTLKSTGNTTVLPEDHWYSLNLNGTYVIED